MQRFCTEILEIKKQSQMKRRSASEDRKREAYLKTEKEKHIWRQKKRSVFQERVMYKKSFKKEKKTSKEEIRGTEQAEDPSPQMLHPKCFCSLVWQAPMSQWCYSTDSFWVLSRVTSPNQQSCVSNKCRDNALCYQAHINIYGDISHYWRWRIVTAIKRKVI